MKISLTVLSCREYTIFMGKSSKGQNSLKNVDGRFFLSTHRLTEVYVCIKFHQNILYGIKVTEPTRFS